MPRCYRENSSAAVASKKPLATFQVCLWLASTPPLVEPRGLYARSCTLFSSTHSRNGIRLQDAARSYPSYATEEDMFVLVLPFFQRGTSPAQHKGWHDARMKLAGSSGQRVFQPPKHKTLNLSPRARAMVWPCVQRLAPSPAQRIGKSR